VNSVQPNSKPDLYVVARIISVLKNQGGVKRTELATKTGVAYDRLSKYVDWMNQEGLLKIDQEGNIYLTKLGIETYNNLVKWILQYVGKIKFPRF
jgi:predicted transcriptional regulator